MSNGLSRAEQPCAQAAPLGAVPLTLKCGYDTVIHMEEILTIRVPQGTRRRLEKLAGARHVTLSQYVRRALEREAKG